MDKRTDKEKLLRLLEVMDKKSSFEEIVLNYMEANKNDFCAYRYTDLIQEITKYFLVPEIVTLENVKAISKERAIYLKTYLEGDMYTTKEAAIEHLPVQIKNAQRIIDVCDGKDLI